ncbi:MAG: glycoside hydrolase family 43 protein [Alistipes sp.]|nr:glycoside hydrolase family 43 protein [Alistipes sp.]
MRHRIFFSSILLLALFCGCKKDKGTLLQNPLDIKLGDPYVLLASDGRYYIYGTLESGIGFDCYSSSDLAEWAYEGRAFDGNTDYSWGTDCFWAPEVYERDGRFYMFYSANWKENPVESEIADWAREQGLFGEIEESWIYGVEMEPDFSGIIGEPVLLLRPPVRTDDTQAEWESRSVTSGEVNRRWTEGSFLLKKDGIYYMMYSANYFGGQHYAVGYATARHPLGPYTKAADNPILEKNIERGGIVTGTGHNSVTWSRDGSQYFCVYHGRTEATGQDRVVLIDRMEIGDGRITVHGPTTEPQVINVN